MPGRTVLKTFLMRNVRRTAAVIFLASVGGICYHVTPPAQITVKQPTDTLVARVIAFLTKNNVPIKDVEQDSEIPRKIVVSKWVDFSEQDVFDWMYCGSVMSDIANDPGGFRLQVRVRFSVFLTPTPDSTRVRVQMDDDQAGKWGGYCSSNGKFERALLASLTARAGTTSKR
jgi:hypothetical protein